MLDLVAETMGARIRKVHVHVPLIRPGVALIEAVAPRPPVTLQQLKMLPLDSITDLGSVEDTFGFAPVPPKSQSSPSVRELRNCQSMVNW